MMVSGGICLIVTVAMLALRRGKCWERIRSPCKILWLFCLLGLLAKVVESSQTGFFEQGLVARNEPGEGELETEAYIYVPELETEYEIALVIPERKYTALEEKKRIAAAKKEIDETFCGTNTSMEDIQENPVVRQSYQEDTVTAEWEFSEGEIIEADGTILQEKLQKKTLVEASVELCCGQRQEIYSFYFQIVPRKKSQREQLLSGIQEQIAGQNITKEQVTLPGDVQGKEIVWKDETSTLSMELVGLGVLAAIAAAYVEKEERAKKVQKRARRLLLEYPEFVSKLSLLLGSGMTISGAFRKMNQMYQNQKSAMENPAYEELYRMLCEMDNGMGELRAYQRFADRCNLQPYRKLVSLLISGQKMGNRKLTECLNEEADRVFLERKNTARKLGEEAGTKLLLPMLLMMALVMGIVMVPAFLSIGQM